MANETFGIGIIHMDGPMPNDLITPGPVAARIWDTSYTTSTLQWPGINTCTVDGGCAAHPELSTFVFDDLDKYLATNTTHGVTGLNVEIGIKPILVEGTVLQSQ